MCAGQFYLYWRIKVPLCAVHSDVREEGSGGSEGKLWNGAKANRCWLAWWVTLQDVRKPDKDDCTKPLRGGFSSNELRSLIHDTILSAKY